MSAGAKGGKLKTLEIFGGITWRRSFRSPRGASAGSLALCGWLSCYARFSKRVYGDVMSSVTFRDQRKSANCLSAGYGTPSILSSTHLALRQAIICEHQKWVVIIDFAYMQYEFNTYCRGLVQHVRLFAAE